MIHLKIQEMFDKHGRSKYWLTSKMGKSHRSVSNLMKEDLSGIHFDTLEQLYNIFNCEIGEIIELRNEKEYKTDEQTNKEIRRTKKA